MKQIELFNMVDNLESNGELSYVQNLIINKPLRTIDVNMVSCHKCSSLRKKNIAIQHKTEGDTLHFCSILCYEQFLLDIKKNTNVHHCGYCSNIITTTNIVKMTKGKTKYFFCDHECFMGFHKGKRV